MNEKIIFVQMRHYSDLLSVSDAHSGGGPLRHQLPLRRRFLIFQNHFCMTDCLSYKLACDQD